MCESLHKNYCKPCLRIFSSHHKTVEKTKRNHVINWICLLFNTNSLTDVERWFKIFSVILLSPYGTTDTKNAISTMRANCNDKY